MIDSEKLVLGLPELHLLLRPMHVTNNFPAQQNYIIAAPVSHLHVQMPNALNTQERQTVGHG